MTGIGTQIKNALSWFKNNLVNNWLIKSCVADTSDQSTVENKALSAWQGKLLQDQINSLNTKLIFDVSVLHLYPIWQVQHFECFKVNGIVTINAALFCNGQINANTNYTMTSESIDSRIIPVNDIRIIGNACDGNFGNTVCANLYLDANKYLKINISNSNCLYVAFSATYRSRD